MMKIDLSKYNNSWYYPGKGLIIRTIWFIVNAIILQNSLIVSSGLKIWLLKKFGAKVGKGVVLKPSINVKYPWNIEIGNYSWIGERVWLDSLGKIKIADNVCISQGVYFCTGNHNWSDPAFGLMIKTITIEEGVWIGANSIVSPNVTIASHSVISVGSVITNSTDPYGIYAGNPATKVKERVIK